MARVADERDRLNGVEMGIRARLAQLHEQIETAIAESGDLHRELRDIEQTRRTYDELEQRVREYHEGANATLLGNHFAVTQHNTLLSVLREVNESLRRGRVGNVTDQLCDFVRACQAWHVQRTWALEHASEVVGHLVRDVEEGMRNVKELIASAERQLRVYRATEATDKFNAVQQQLAQYKDELAALEGAMATAQSAKESVTFRATEHASTSERAAVRLREAVTKVDRIVVAALTSNGSTDMLDGACMQALEALSQLSPKATVELAANGDLIRALAGTRARIQQHVLPVAATGDAAAAGGAPAGSEGKPRLIGDAPIAMVDSVHALLVASADSVLEPVS